MEPWIEHPTILKGREIDLLPLEKDHFEALYQAAVDRRLWELIPTNCADPEIFKKTYTAALEGREKGTQYPFIIYHKATNSIIGSTRYFEIYPADKKLEIGWSWIITKYWGTCINLECKLLMLTHCFEVLKARRVQLKTDENNWRSRKAIEKIGGYFEGVLRKDKIKADGTSRSAAYYSILDDEYPAAKEKILAQLAQIDKR
ncbi:MAG: GNAT family N-acetyltransferase [Chitinophaga sp.]|uniref:GNAT family N-acetyltransferase n=1 Tax=Chitinophaga sp. TaxID=1869181 RepID=UPI0025BF5FAE|nr:GNAT family N-acetyltransferase [Chitinophaga sp.]MBV8255614.1 GNAT family N-acetyltransferase [Chitinophaga sp.]